MRPISSCLSKPLENICHQALRLEALNAQLQMYLPPALAKHCFVGSFSKGCLQIVLQQAIWATELRYTLPSLRDKLRKEAGFYQLTSIKLIIRENEAYSALLLNKRPKRVLSATARALIQGASKDCAYLPLKEALQRLSLPKEES